MNQRDNLGWGGLEAAENPDNVEDSDPIYIPTCPAYIKIAKTLHKLSSILQTWLGSTDHLLDTEWKHACTVAELSLEFGILQLRDMLQ